MLNVPVQPFAIIALLASIALIVLFLIKPKKENLAFSITGIVGAVSLIALNIHAKMQMSKGSLNETQFSNEVIQLSWTIWYWLCLVLFVVVASVNMKLHKQKLYVVFIAVLFTSCDLLDPQPKVKTATGAWTTENFSGGNNFSPRNHYYTFEVKSERVVTVTLDLTKPGAFAVYNSLGQRVTYTFSGLSHTQDITLSKDNYTILVYLSDRYEIGEYTLTVVGTDSDLHRTNSRTESDKLAGWAPDGAGGNYYTPKNAFYTFNVNADNSYVDINLDIADNNGWISLTDSLAQVIERPFSGRRVSVIEKLNRGKYGVWVGTSERNVVGSNYTLTVVGDVSRLEKFKFVRQEAKGTWSGNSQTIAYKVDVLDNNSILDISLKSPNTNARITLLDPNGRQLNSTFSGPDQSLINNVSKGTYTINISNSNGLGNPYTLIVYGNYVDLKQK